MQIFHLGYPKCGSTTIQNLLRADPSVNFLGKPYRTPEAAYFVREYLPFADLRQLAPDRLAAMRTELCVPDSVLSEELLSGIGFRHGIATNSLQQTIDNIELLTDGAFVAHVVLRRPMDFVRSYYGHLARMGTRMSFDQFCSLVLVRRHHWVFQALNYRAILESKRVSGGQLRVALFEQLFAGGGLADYMHSAFGSQSLPDSPSAIRANPSDTDSVVDAAAARYTVNPASPMEIQISRPSLQEQVWIDRLTEPDKSMHVGLWLRERAEAMQRQGEMLAIIGDARASLGMRRGKRPASPIFLRLLAEVAELNAGLSTDFPELGLADHGYFDPPDR